MSALWGRSPASANKSDSRSCDSETSTRPKSRAGSFAGGHARQSGTESPSAPARNLTLSCGASTQPLPAQARNVTLSCGSFSSQESALLSSESRYQLWHSRLAHLSPQLMKKSIGAVEGFDLKSNDIVHGLKCICASCQVGKLARLSFSKRPRTRAPTVGERLHTDLLGPMRTESLLGFRYAQAFVDDTGGFSWLHFLKAKSDWFHKFVELHAFLVRQFKIELKSLRADGEAIFMSRRVTKWLRERGIRRETTARGASQLNGRAERFWRTIVNLARAMLAHAGLKDQFWDHAMEHANYILNRVCRGSMTMTPYESLYGKKPDLSNLRVVGCAAYVRIPSDMRHKWTDKARKCIYLGVDAEKIGHKVMDAKTRRVFVARDVVFDESLLPARKAIELLEAKTMVKNVSAKTDRPILESARARVNGNQSSLDALPEPLPQLSQPLHQELSLRSAPLPAPASRPRSPGSFADGRDVADGINDEIADGIEGQASPDVPSDPVDVSIPASGDGEPMGPSEDFVDDSILREDDLDVKELGSTSLADLPAPGGEVVDFFRALALDQNELQSYDTIYQCKLLDPVSKQDQDLALRGRDCVSDCVSADGMSDCGSVSTRLSSAEACNLTLSCSLPDSAPISSDVYTPSDSKISSDVHTPSDSNDACTRDCNASLAEAFVAPQERAYEVRNGKSVHYVLIANDIAVPQNDPKTVKAAEASPDWLMWKQAMEAEKKSLAQLGTWTALKEPAPRKPVKCKWVFLRKFNNGVLEKYKARLVACGYSQRYGIDYQEVFAPVLRLESFRVVLSIAAWEGLTLNHLDVSTAFLHGVLSDDERIYMRLTPDFGADATGRPRDVLLNRSIYGLKQASRKWNKELDRVFKSFGFNKKNYSDACLYTLTRGDAKLIVLVHVDDMITAWRGKALFEAFKKCCNENFKTKDLGPLTFALGIRVARPENFLPEQSISIDQEAFIDEMAEEFGMSKCKPVPTPQVPKQYLEKASSSNDADGVRCLNAEEHKLYRKLVGKMLYLNRATRPDISNAVRELSRFVSQPNQDHWQAAKRLLRYVIGSKRYKLTLGGQPVLYPYADADWANSSNRRSISGMAIKLGRGLVSWKSKMQSTVTLSSTEAEYNSLSETAREVIWLRHLLADLGHEQAGPTVIYEDNQQTIVWAQDPKHHGRNKHLDVKLHYIREQVAQKTLAVEYVATQNQLADVMTKPLGPMIFRRLVPRILDTSVT